jgi:hypothetical protein
MGKFYLYIKLVNDIIVLIFSHYVVLSKCKQGVLEWKIFDYTRKNRSHVTCNKLWQIFVCHMWLGL